jgi:hypothetical protein
MGWRARVVFECELKDKAALAVRLAETLAGGVGRPPSVRARNDPSHEVRSPASPLTPHARRRVSGDRQAIRFL